MIFLLSYVHSYLTRLYNTIKLNSNVILFLAYVQNLQLPVLIDCNLNASSLSKEKYNISFKTHKVYNNIRSKLYQTFVNVIKTWKHYILCTSYKYDNGQQILEGSIKSNHKCSLTNQYSYEEFGKYNFLSNGVIFLARLK